MAKMRLIDANKLKPVYIDYYGEAVDWSTIEYAEEIDPETLPIVRELREQVQNSHRRSWKNGNWMGYRRKAEAESACEDRAAVKTMRKHCEKTIADLRAKLAQVTAERDALKENPPVQINADSFELAAELAQVTAERDKAVKDRAKLSDLYLTMCEQFCFGDRKRDIAPCEWNWFGRCKLREWCGPKKEE